MARVVSFCESTPDPYDLETANLTLFLTEHSIVTTHMESLPTVQALLERLRSNPDLLARGPARLAHQTLDVAVDAYFPVLDRLDEFVDEVVPELQDRGVFRADYEHDTLRGHLDIPLIHPLDREAVAH